MSKSTQSSSTHHDRQTSFDATTARVKLPTEEFALTELFEQTPDTRVELTPTVTHPDNHALLDIQTTECNRSTVETIFQTDPNIATADRYGEHTNGWIYQVTWGDHTRNLIQRLTDEDVMLLTAQAYNGQWQFRLVTPTRDTFSRVYEAVRELGYNPDCQSITSFNKQQSTASEMTDKQRETLIEAYETGYYNIPRDITSQELADRLDLSHQALSERFQRAHKRLVDSNLMTDDN